MTYQQFEAKWLGKRVDIDGLYGYQCADLVKQYLLECFGIPNGSYGDAIVYWTNPHQRILEKFGKVAGSAANQGDIVILNPTATNEYGHIGIATGRLTDLSVEILEQNGSTGNGSGLGNDAIRKRYVPRTRVAGLLRAKGVNVEKVDLNTARILASGVGFRDGYDGRENAHKGDSDKELSKNHVGQPLTNAYVYGWFQSKEAGNGRDKQHKAYQARDNALKQVGKLESTNSELQKALGIKDAEIERLTARLAAKGDDKEVSISAALKILVQAVKDAWFNK